MLKIKKNKIKFEPKTKKDNLQKKSIRGQICPKWTKVDQIGANGLNYTDLSRLDGPKSKEYTEVD